MQRHHRLQKAALLLVALLLLLPSLHGEESKAHLTILAVAIDDRGNMTGLPADLYLEVQPGESRVFMDTYPLQKIDTQISTRVAKEIACAFLDQDCADSDFIYTIRAQSSVISGPSASGAIAVITAALLDGQKLDESVAMTGTINSGGIIGGVDGIKEKIDAASQAGIRTVLIPYGTNISLIGNETVDLYAYGKEKGIVVIEVSTLREALFYFTGKKYPSYSGDIIIDEQYLTTMRSVASGLCERNADILTRLPPKEDFSGTGVSNLTEKSKDAFAQGKYYSAASYCYGINAVYRNRQFRDLPIMRAYAEINALTEQIQAMQNYSYSTISNLQTSMVVNERLTEAEEYLRLAVRWINNTEIRNTNLALAKERIYSAEAWSAFFDDSSASYAINTGALKQFCFDKLAETEERMNYLGVVNPELVTDIYKDFQGAQSFRDREDYVLCLFEASKTQAKINLIYETLMMKPENLPHVIDQKAALVKEIILRQQSKGIFPFLGYSYYEYALSLKEEDPFSSLLYLHYAQQFSDMDIYFKELVVKVPSPSQDFRKNKTFAFAEGILVGIILAYLALEVMRHKKERR